MFRIFAFLIFASLILHETFDFSPSRGINQTSEFEKTIYLEITIIYIKLKYIVL